MNGFWKKFSKSFTVISNSASFALLLSILFFSYESIENSKETEAVTENLIGIQQSLDPMVKELTEIQNSLSTRYLGIFPVYIENINKLLGEAMTSNVNSHINDTVIIFEDVLHYGVLSAPDGFKRLMKNLLVLSDGGCKITIVHYATDSRQFKQMVSDELIPSDVQLSYRNELRGMIQFGDTASFECYMDNVGATMKKYFGGKYNLASKADQQAILNIIKGDGKRRNRMESLENYMLEYHFAANKAANKERFESALNRVHGIKLAVDSVFEDSAEFRVNELCKKLDSLKLHYMGKPLDEIRYADYLAFYQQMTASVAEMLNKQSTVEILPISESIMMCCWMADIDGNEKAIFAFPSKYSTDEIGFISRDDAIIKYINTMLRGVRMNLVSVE